MEDRWRRHERERNEREGQKAKKCVRKKYDTAGPDLEALEGDTPDSCRRVWIILGPLLARGLQKTTALIRIKSTVRLYVETTWKKRGISCDFWLLLSAASVRQRFLLPPTKIRRLTRRAVGRLWFASLQTASENSNLVWACPEFWQPLMSRAEKCWQLMNVQCFKVIDLITVFWQFNPKLVE